MRAYLVILNDDLFFQNAIDHVKNDYVNIEFAIYQEKMLACEAFQNMDDPYLRERGLDIENVCNTLLSIISGKESEIDMGQLDSEKVIVVAEDLTPEDTVKLDKTKLGGFVIEKGGVTSHGVILAKALGIPTVVGVNGAIAQIDSGNELIVDGDNGKVFISPDAKATAEYHQIITEREELNCLYQKAQTEKAIALDGIEIAVNINTGDEESLKTFDPSMCDGIGLVRTEFLYMGRDTYPSEDDQFNVYKDIAKRAAGKEVIIRTLDVGGDKQIEYMDLPKESNPFLGYRAIRLCLDRREIFNVQLRAILRASAFGNIKIMFPMIVNMEELRMAKDCVNKAKAELMKENIPFNNNVGVGIMVETPAAVLLSDKLAEEVDFFSVGSNDLIQYLTATDRLNQKVHWLYDSYNISFLRSIKIAVDSAHKAGIPIGICGETASEELLIPLWAAMGIDELSVAPSQVGHVKYTINNVSVSELSKQLPNIFENCNIADIKEALKKYLKK